MLFQFCFPAVHDGRGEVNTEQNSQAYVEDEDYQNFLYPMSAFVKVENGYYFFNRLMLYYFDAQTKETYPVCNNPNCDHTTSSCMAFFNIFNFYPFLMSYYKNTLYVWGWEEDGSVRHNYIYSVSLDDYKRKKAAFLYDGNQLRFQLFHSAPRIYLIMSKTAEQTLKSKSVIFIQSKNRRYKPKKRRRANIRVQRYRRIRVECYRKRE